VSPFNVERVNFIVGEIIVGENRDVSIAINPDSVGERNLDT
jgi:hypothetical protein